MSEKQNGFSLIELLIVVAIVLIIAAIAVPSLIRSRMAANEASAAASIRLMNTAASTYNTIFGNGFPPSMAAVGTTGANPLSCTNAELLDSVLTAGTKSGYTFVLVPGATQLTGTSSSCAAGFGYSDGYVVTANPIGATTGKRTFCSDASGEIRVNPASIAAYSTPNCTDTTILSN